MNQAKFVIELTANPDGMWHVEATATYPEVKILSTSGNTAYAVLVGIEGKINECILSWPEHLRPGYKPPMLAPGTLVEHVRLPDTVLEVVDGPKDSAVYAGMSFYSVKLPNGEVTTALGRNLRRPYEEEKEQCQKQQ
jgi:hypothetical protein